MEQVNVLRGMAKAIKFMPMSSVLPAVIKIYLALLRHINIRSY